jgi:hypothetical protein
MRLGSERDLLYRCPRNSSWLGNYPAGDFQDHSKQVETGDVLSHAMPLTG